MTQLVDAANIRFERRDVSGPGVAKDERHLALKTLRAFEWDYDRTVGVLQRQLDEKRGYTRAEKLLTKRTLRCLHELRHQHADAFAELARDYDGAVAQMREDTELGRNIWNLLH